MGPEPTAPSPACQARRPPRAGRGRRPLAAWTRGACRAALAALALLAVAPPSPAAAQAADAAAGAAPRYQGAFWGLEARLGLAGRARPADGESLAPVVAVAARLATLLSVLDVQAFLEASRFTSSTAAGAPVAVGRLSLGGEARLHPLLLSHLEGGRLGATLGAAYLGLGLDLALVRYAPDAGASRRDTGLGVSLGGGLDVPLRHPDAGPGLWLGAGARYRWADADRAGPRVGRLDGWAVLVTLAWRNPSLDFARVPPPEELRWRDPPDAGGP